MGRSAPSAPADASGQFRRGLAHSVGECRPFWARYMLAWECDCDSGRRPPRMVAHGDRDGRESVGHLSVLRRVTPLARLHDYALELGIRVRAGTGTVLEGARIRV